MKNQILLLSLMLILPVIALAQSKFVRVVNTIAELQSSNPSQIHTNVFVADTNAGGIYVYLRGTTNSVLPFVPTTYTGQTGIYVRTIPVLFSLDTNALNLTMLSQAGTNTLYIGQNPNTRLIAFADPASGISSYELDVAGVARMVLSVGTNANDNFIQVFDSNAVSVFKVAGDGSTYVGDTTNRVYAFVDRAAKISSLELDAGTLLRMILSAGTNATDNSFQMFDTNSSAIFKIDSVGNITRIRGSDYSWPSTNSTPGYLFNDGAGGLTFTATTNSAVLSESWQIIGTGANYGISTNWGQVTFGGNNPVITLTNAGTYQIMVSVSASANNTFYQHYYLTNITDSVMLPGTSRAIFVTSGEATLPLITQYSVASGPKVIQLWGLTDDPAYTADAHETISTNTVVNVIKLY